MNRVKPLAILSASLLWVMSPETSLACERCFGALVDSPIITAISASMFLLLVLVTGVFGGFVAFFRNIRSREKAIAQQDSQNAELLTNDRPDSRTP